MAATKSTPRASGIACTFHVSCVEIVGTADELIADDLALPAWLPVLPKRTAADWASLDDWEWDDPLRDRDARFGWDLRRLAGGVFRLTLHARSTRLFLGGPIDHDAARRVLGRHQALVRAGGDLAFRRFLAGLTA